MSQGYLESFFESSTVDWKGIYLLPGQNIINTKHCSFQYKILNNVLYLNKLLFKFRKVKSPLCSIYKSAEESIILYLLNFYEDNIYGIKLRSFFSGYITIPDLTTQSTIFGFTHTSTEHFSLINHLSLIYKC